jgi:diaminopimelate decarboxylase
MSTPFTYFKYKKNGLEADGVSLARVADQTGTPVYVYSKSGFLEPLEKLRSGLATIDHLICFAVKSNSNVAILKMLGHAGSGMDIVSGGELYRAEAAQVDGTRIVFSGVGKTPGEIASALEYADGQGIYSFNVESIPELEMINAVAKKLGKKARVALRFNPDVDAKTHPYISTGLKQNKFGMNRLEIIALLKKMKAGPTPYQNVVLRGIGIHIGSQLLSLSPLNDAFSKAWKLVAEIEDLLPGSLEFIDLGGGVGVGYKKERPPSIENYCALILKHFARAKQQRLLGRALRVLIEPGRIISGNSGVLVTEVLFRKTRRTKDFVIVDAAMNDLIRPSLYGSYHEIAPVNIKSSRSKTKKADVVGPVCETSDCFGEARVLPAELEQGDLLAILSSGAYGFSMASNYNSRPRPPEVLLHDGKFSVIRNRESYEDLILHERALT